MRRLLAFILGLLFVSLLSVSGLAQDQARRVVTLQQIDGFWWFVSPDGEPFVSLGVNHFTPNLWLASYNRENTIHRYGQDLVDERGRFNPQSDAARRMVEDASKIITDLNFNSFGMHTADDLQPLIPEHVYYIPAFEVDRVSSWALRDNDTSGLPDVFSAEFEQKLATRVKEVCLIHRHRPNVLGYAFSDLPVFYRWAPRPEQRIAGETYLWARELTRRSADTPGKQRWIDTLRTRHATAADAAAIYDLDVDSWDALAAESDFFKPTRDLDAAEADHIAFTQAIAQRWYQLHHENIRQWDEHHLIFGDKFMPLPDWLLEVISPYIDLNFVQRYQHFDGYSAQDLARIHASNGKPILNGDGATFTFPRPEQNHSAKGLKLESEAAVAEAYHRYVADIMAAPFMVGYQRCGFMEEWDKSGNETGFMDPFFNLRETLAEAHHQSNAAAAQMRREHSAKAQ